MGFGAIIATGKNHEVLSPELLGYVSEVRVEQELSGAIKYAIRFEDDICPDGEFHVGESNLLQLGKYLTIAASVGPEQDKALHCLVHGPITEVKRDMQLGGPGSWIEVHGTDRRIEMDRQEFRAAWQGTETQIAQSVLGGYWPKSEVGKTEKNYKDETTYNQSGSDLKLIKKIASENEFYFWIDYECKNLEKVLVIKEKANLRPSPDIGKGSPIPKLGSLVKQETLQLRMHVDGDQCPNLSSFKVEMVGERPTEAEISSLDTSDVNKTKNLGGNKLKGLAKGGTELKKVATDDGGKVIKRSIVVKETADPIEAKKRADAAIRKASWFVKAEGSTTTEKLENILKPHDIVQVIGSGGTASTTYQVKSVTHVINAAAHYMDFELRANTIGS